MATTVIRNPGKNPFIQRELDRRRSAVTGVFFAQSNGQQAPDGSVSPEEAAQIRSSAAGKEQAPTQQQQAKYVNWRAVQDVLGDPFNTENIPTSKLRLMRRDPVIGFGLSFIKTPHVRAKWYIDAKDQNGPNAQIAAHLDHDLRQIMASFILQWSNSLDFGFQGLARRFQFQTPVGTYIQRDASGSISEAPIWNQGNIQPISWKPFVALPPETIEPIWNNDGSFGGIDYDASQASQGGASAAPPPGTGARPKGGSGNKDKFQIDLPHSLWVTNDKDSNFGSIFGYPRLGYSYQMWWSYWFRWSITDRAFEKKADPSILIYHPQGKFVDPATGTEISYSDYALEMGNRMRSGGIITLPSTPYEGANGPSNVREWEIDFTKDSMNFDLFDKSFDYLDIAKIRSLWIPEQSLVEGKGGTSSRNVAAQFDSSFTESQAVMSIQIVDTINRWVIPQWLAINYPEFILGNGTAKLVIQGFADEDVAFTQQIIQLIGQQQSGVDKLITMIDLRKVLDDAGVPMLDPLSQKAEEAKLVQAQQQLSQPPAVTPKPGKDGTVGVVPSATGFSMQYIQPREVIYLSDRDMDKRQITIKRTSELDDGVIARFDSETNTILLSEEASLEDEQKYIAAIGESLVAAA